LKRCLVLAAGINVIAVGLAAWGYVSQIFALLWTAQGGGLPPDSLVAIVRFWTILCFWHVLISFGMAMVAYLLLSIFPGRILSWSRVILANLGMVFLLILLGSLVKPALLGPLWKRAGSEHLLKTLLSMVSWRPGESDFSALANANKDAKDPPNVVLIVVDSMRPDHMSAYGYKRESTPFLSWLSKRATRYENVYVPLARTTPSWVSLLTGTYPHTHGIRHMFPRPSQRTIDLVTLPQWLSFHGYATALSADFAGDFFQLFDFGFEQKAIPPAFDIWRLLEQPALVRDPLLLSATLFPFGGNGLETLKILPTNADSSLVTKNALRLLHKIPSDQPFFLTLFYSAPHIPYASPQQPEVHLPVVSGKPFFRPRCS